MEKLQLKPGIITGTQLQEVFAYCKENQCALPAVNVIGSNTIAAALQAAKESQSPIIIQFSHGGAIFNAGKQLDNTNQKAAIAGAIAGALQIRHLSNAYGVPVILHTDHCAKKLIPWVEGLITYGEEFFTRHGVPLFSSHMLDLSEEPLTENLAISARILQRLAKINMTLEIELGITGGEEDGVDNSHVDSARLYTSPQEVLQAYDALKPHGNFTIAAAFGNVHGVYKPGNVELTPSILKDCQDFIAQERQLGAKPIDFVFHGGSGSEKHKITEGVCNGAIKFNIDTDNQWAFTHPIQEYMDMNKAYLLSQIGNPEGTDIPNKSKIDPRAWLHVGEKGSTARLIEAFKDLNSYNKFSF